MNINQYWSSFDRAKASEVNIRKYLIANSDSFRLTREANETDNKFIDVLSSLEQSFIKKEINNKRFNDVEQSKNSKFEHFFYSLNDHTKKIFKEETLLFNFWSSSLLYGFEDPTFYKNGKMIGCVISHEPMICLYISEELKSTLENFGISFDSED